MTLHNLQGEPVTDPALADFGISDLSFNGFQFSRQLEDLITAVDVERSMEEPSSLVIALHDPGRLLQNAGALSEAADVSVGPHDFRVVKVDKADDGFTLTCEDRDVAKLRLNRKAKKASRGKVTRSQFLKSCVDETPGIRFWAPDLDRKQPTASPDTPLGTAVTGGSRTKKDAAASSRKPGIAPRAHLRVKGHPADSEQVRVMGAVLAAAATVNPSPRALLALVEAIIVEVEFRNVQGSGPDSISFGVIQNIPGRSAGIHGTFTKAQALDISYSVRSALQPPGPTSKGGLIKLAREHPDWSPGRVAAVAINGGGDPAYAGKCDGYRSDALAIIEAFDGAVPSDVSAGDSVNIETTTTSLKTYEFTRGTDQGHESTYDCGKRLADEVHKRFLVIDHECLFAFDRDLMKQKPAATIREYEDGVNTINWSRDAGKKIETASVSCRAGVWAARPADVIVVEGQGDDDGGGNGRWLVSRVSGSLFEVDRMIELTRPMRGLKEPSAETTTNTTTATASQAARSSGGAAGATGAGKGKWAYSGCPHTLNSKMRSFMDRMATFYDGTLSVTTTTNHNYLTSSGNVSDHNGGGAADLGSVANWGGGDDAPGGFKITIAAHRACGESYETAVKNANRPNFDRFPCKESPGHGAQILWRVEGHHDHVHVGIGP